MLRIVKQRTNTIRDTLNALINEQDLLENKHILYTKFLKPSKPKLKNK